MLAIKIAIGIAIGTVCIFAGMWLKKILLNKRNLDVYASKFEVIVTSVFTIIAGIAVMIRYQAPAEIAYTYLILIICILVAVIDLHHRIIPNELPLAMLIIKLGIGIPELLNFKNFKTFNVKSSLIGFAVGFVIFAIPAVFGKAVGAGDIKLAAAIGFCLGVEGLLYSVVLMGGGVLLFAIAQKNKSLRTMIYEMIPMGPFMAISMIVVMILPSIF